MKPNKLEQAIIKRMSTLEKFQGKETDIKIREKTDEILMGLNLVLNIKELEKEEGLSKPKKQKILHLLEISDEYIKELNNQV